MKNGKWFVFGFLILSAIAQGYFGVIGGYIFMIWLSGLLTGLAFAVAYVV